MRQRKDPLGSEDEGLASFDLQYCPLTRLAFRSLKNALWGGMLLGHNDLVRNSGPSSNPPCDVTGRKSVCAMAATPPVPEQLLKFCL